MTNIDREALLNALHEAIDGDMLIDDDGEAIGLSEVGAADVKAAEAKGFNRGAAAGWDEGYQAGVKAGESGYVAGTYRRIAGMSNPYRAALAATEDQP